MATKKVAKKAKLKLPNKLKTKRDEALKRGDVRKARKAQKEIILDTTYDFDDKLLARFNISINRMEHAKGEKPIPPNEYAYKGGPKNVVQFRVSGGKKVQREFEWSGNLLEANRYLLEFMRLHGEDRKYRTSHISPNGLLITFPPSNDKIFSNYPIPYILMGKPIPKEGLRDIFLPKNNGNNNETHVGAKYAVPPEKKEMPEPSAEEMLGKPSVKKAARQSGKLIPLKVICGELDVDPRQARVKLRKAVKDKANYPDLAASHAHHARWEWVEGSKALEDVKRAIANGGKK